jgi:hypothetical protein
MYKLVTFTINEFPVKENMIPEESKNVKKDEKKGLFSNFFGKVFKSSDKGEKAEK